MFSEVFWNHGRRMSDYVLPGTNDSMVKWTWRFHFPRIGVLAALNRGEIQSTKVTWNAVLTTAFAAHTFSGISRVFTRKAVCCKPLQDWAFLSPTLVISKAAAQTDQVIALSQDLMTHKTPKVQRGPIHTASQTLRLSVQEEKGPVGTHVWL